MDDALGVRRGEAVGYLNGVVDGATLGELADHEGGSEQLAFEQLLDDVGGALVSADVVDDGDVGVIQGARGLGLLFETAQAIADRKSRRLAGP